MTRNPYAQMDNLGGPGHAGGFGGPGDFDAPPRTSALAVASLIVSIVSLIICCIPGPGVLGMFLALGAVISISGSGGRRRGTGMAVAGLLLGLVATVFSVLVWLGISMLFASFTAHHPTLEAVWQRDAAAVAAEFEPSAAPQITRDRLDAFVQEVESELGPYQQLPRGLLDIVRGYNRIGPVMQASGQQQPYTGQIMPLPGEFDRGWAPVLFELPPDVSAGTHKPTLRNLGVILPRSHRVVWLIDSTTVPPTVPAPTPPALPPADPDAPTDGATDGADREPAPDPDPATEPDPAEDPEAQPDPGR